MLCLHIPPRPELILPGLDYKPLNQLKPRSSQKQTAGLSRGLERAQSRRSWIPGRPPDPGAPLERFLAELPQRQRQVVQSLAVDGASVPETALKLDMTHGAVCVAFHRGLAALAVKFGEWS